MTRGIGGAPESPGLLRRAWRRRRMRWGVTIFALLVLAAAAADFVAPYRPETQTTELAFAPPARLQIAGSDRSSPCAYVCRTVASFDPVTYARTFTEVPGERYAIHLFGRGVPYRLWGIFPANVHLFTLGEDAARDGVRIYLWGADRLGRDVFTRTLFGGRLSLAVGPIVLLLLFPLAVLIGGVSGMLGGWVDLALQRVGEAIGSLPSLPLLLIVGAGVTAANASHAVRILAILAALAGISWTGMARVVRGQVLALREREFVLAARAYGAGRLRILLRDVLPHVAATVTVGAALVLPGTMLLESSLSFFGLGMPEPTPSWGTLLAGAASLCTLAAAPWLLVPGVFILCSALAANFIADALREATGGAADEGRQTRGTASRRRRARRSRLRKRRAALLSWFGGSV